MLLARAAGVILAAFALLLTIGCARTGAASASLTPLVMPSVPVVVEATTTEGRLVMRNLGDAGVLCGPLMVTESGAIVCLPDALEPRAERVLPFAGTTFVYLGASASTLDTNPVWARVEGQGGGLALRLHSIDSIQTERVVGTLPEVPSWTPGLLVLAEPIPEEAPEPTEPSLLGSDGEIRATPEERAQDEKENENDEPER